MTKPAPKSTKQIIWCMASVVTRPVWESASLDFCLLSKGAVMRKAPGSPCRPSSSETTALEITTFANRSMPHWHMAQVLRTVPVLKPNLPYPEQCQDLESRPQSKNSFPSRVHVQCQYLHTATRGERDIPATRCCFCSVRGRIAFEWANK